MRFMVESPAQSGRMRTLIHPGPVSGVHVTGADDGGRQPAAVAADRASAAGCGEHCVDPPERPHRLSGTRRASGRHSAG